MMKLFEKTTSLLVAGLLAFVLVSSPAAFSEDSTNEVEVGVEQKLLDEQFEQTDQKRREVVEEATSAIRETQDALTALDNGDTEKSLAALERAIGKLELILAREPGLALAPANVSATTTNVIASIEAIEAIRKQAEDALEQGRLQDARHMLDSLASEMVISVTSIPLSTYPAAIKQAVRLIDNDDTEAAVRLLKSTLNTLVVSDTIIPLPVAAAGMYLEEAQVLAEKAERSDEENAELAELLDSAGKELKMARALGYGNKENFDNLYAQLDEITSQTEGGKHGVGFFTKIKSFLKDTVDSSQPEAPGNTG